MSLVLDIKNFPNLSSVLAEIEKKGRRPENFTAVYSEFEQLHQHERKPASFTAMEGDSRAFIATDSQLANFDEEVRKPRSSTVTGDMRTFIEIDPEDVNLYSLERKPRSSSMMERGAVVDAKANGRGAIKKKSKWIFRGIMKEQHLKGLLAKFSIPGQIVLEI